MFARIRVALSVAIVVSLSGSLAGAADYRPLAQQLQTDPATLGSLLDPNIAPNQQARVDVVDPLAPVDTTSDGILQNVFITMPGDPGDPNNPVASYSTITAFIEGDRTVRLRFAEVDNQYYFNFGVDNCSLVVPGGPDLLLNGSFENNGGVLTEVFANWTVYNESLDTGGFYAQTGMQSPGNLFPVPAPTDGVYAAMTDQLGPGLHILYQDVAIPPAGAQLTCDVFVGSQAPFAIPGSFTPAPAPALGTLGLSLLLGVLLWRGRRALRAVFPA